MLSTSATDGRARSAATFAVASSKEPATISSNRTDRFVCWATRCAHTSASVSRVWSCRRLASKRTPPRPARERPTRSALAARVARGCRRSQLGPAVHARGGVPPRRGGAPALHEHEQRRKHAEGGASGQEDAARADDAQLHQPLEPRQEQHGEGERRRAGGGHDAHAGAGERALERLAEGPSGPSLLLEPGDEVDGVVTQSHQHRHEHDRQEVQVSDREGRDPEGPADPDDQRDRREGRPDEATEEHHEQRRHAEHGDDGREGHVPLGHAHLVRLEDRAPGEAHLEPGIAPLEAPDVGANALDGRREPIELGRVPARIREDEQQTLIVRPEEAVARRELRIDPPRAAVHGDW